MSVLVNDSGVGLDLRVQEVCPVDRRPTRCSQNTQTSKRSLINLQSMLLKIFYQLKSAMSSKLLVDPD